MKKWFTFYFLFFAILAFSQDRNLDPVVLRGSSVSCMLGKQPSQIVAFRYKGTWEQIPMQVDEIVVKDMKTPYGPTDCIERSSENVPWMVEFYADANTYTGADTDLTFDSNDELVFMAKDDGDKITGNACPAGVLGSTRCEITIKDPIDNSILGYVYVFQQDGSLLQSAGKSYVSYNYSYKDNYKTAYNICVFNGTNNNPENSVVTTTDYEIGFSQRWVEDVLKIKVGDANGKDILDRHQIFINESACNRNEQVFSDGKGPIVTNFVGPVRAIRSVMGAASGTFTEETIKFTQHQAAYTIFYRLHTANGYNDVFDFSPDASGMTYYNNTTLQGVTINGSQDAVNVDQVHEWELIKGAQGALVTTFEYTTDIKLGTESQYNAGTVEGYVRAYYSDAGTAASYTCTGDGRQYGSTGFALKTEECTDFRADFEDYPECRNPRTFTEYRTHYFLAPSTTTSQAERYGKFGKNPLIATSIAMSCGGTSSSCSDGIKNGNETGVDCGGTCPACPVIPTCSDGIKNGNETGVDCGGTDCSPCNTGCSTPTGLFVSNNTGTQATLNWSPVSSATNYTVEYRKSGASKWKSRKVSTPNFTMTRLQSGKTYEWRVRSNCGTNSSEFSAPQTFVAGALGRINFNNPSVLNSNAAFASTDKSNSDLEINPVMAYPSPAQDWLTVTAHISIHRIWVLDLTGRVKLMFNVPTDATQMQIPVQELSSGYYVLKVQTGSSFVTTRFIKQ